MAYLDPTARAIVNGLQGGFPLTSRPFRDAGRKLGLTEDELIEGVRDLTASGALSRFGPLWNAERFAPGPAVLHLEFTPRGNEVWVSVRDADRIDIYDAATFAKKAEIPAQKPSGIFFTARATRIGQ